MRSSVIYLVEVAVLAAAAAACGHTAVTPTGPTSSTLQITAASPGNPSPSLASQVLTFAGQGFQPGLALTVADPSGAITDVSGGAVTNVTPTSFQAFIPLLVAGTYTISVVNPSGAPSAPFQLQVGNGSSTPEKPAIATITPTSTTKGTQAQPVTITGTHFDASSSLQVTAPDGSAAQVSGFVVTSSTSIQCAVVFNETGTYSVTVVTSGGLSNSVQVSVSGL